MRFGNIASPHLGMAALWPVAEPPRLHNALRRDKFLVRSTDAAAKHGEGPARAQIELHIALWHIDQGLVCCKVQKTESSFPGEHNDVWGLRVSQWAL